nr:hypothetical protein [Tanacetum cinerariifolium]
MVAYKGEKDLLTLIQRLSHRLSELRAPEETNIPQPLLVVPPPVSSSDDFHLIVGQAHTPVTVDTEFKPEEAPSEIEEFQPLVSRAPLTDEEFEHSKPSDTRITSSRSSTSSDSVAPLSPDHPLTQVSPTPTPNRVSYLYDEGYGLEDEVPGLKKEEEVAPEGQQQAVLFVDTAMDKPLGLRYETPPSSELSSGSLRVSPSSPVVPTLVASLATTLAATISVDEDQFLEVAKQLELHESILHDHTQRLDALCNNPSF